MIASTRCTTGPPVEEEEVVAEEEVELDELVAEAGPPVVALTNSTCVRPFFSCSFFSMNSFCSRAAQSEKSWIH